MQEKGIEDILENVRLKAEAQTLRLVITLPDALVDGLKEELGYVEDELEVDEG
jgi:hypothetical protein